MSWRIAILPCTIAGDPVSEDHRAGADAIIPEGATDSFLQTVVKQYAWQRPLKIFAPSLNDSRLVRLRALLEDEGVTLNDYHLYIRLSDGSGNAEFLCP